jgi:hypothetical protein
MADVTQVLSAIELGDPHAAAELLPLVYDESRKLAAQKLAREQPGQTLEPTALVHEAYLRLVKVHEAQRWKPGPFLRRGGGSDAAHPWLVSARMDRTPVSTSRVSRERRLVNEILTHWFTRADCQS